MLGRAKDVYMGAVREGWEAKLYELLKQVLAKDSSDKIDIHLDGIKTQDPKELAKMIRLELLRLERSGVGT